MLKKRLVIICILIGLVSITYLALLNMEKPKLSAAPNAATSIKQILSTADTSKEELYNHILVSLLYAHTQKAVDDFYSKYLKEIPGADPNFDSVLSVENIGEDGRLEYLIKIETMPYLGPHNSVGRDQITFRINAIGEVSLEKFEHIESSPIVPQLYPHIIKSWPPE